MSDSLVPNPSYFKKCSTCKKEISFGSKYYCCSVSTCNRKRAGFYFCSVTCWDAHAPVMNHRDSWADQKQAPGKAEYIQELQNPTPRKRKSVDREPVAPPPRSAPRTIIKRQGQTLNRVDGNLSGDTSGSGSVSGSGLGQAGPGLGTSSVVATSMDQEILVVVSKVKAYVKAKSGMSMSDRAMPLLSEIIRRESQTAIRKAIQNERKTVLDRDFG